MIDAAYESFVNDLCFGTANEEYFSYNHKLTEKVNKLVNDNGSLKSIMREFKSNIKSCKKDRDAIELCKDHLKDVDFYMQQLSQLIKDAMPSNGEQFIQVMEVYALCYTLIGIPFVLHSATKRDKAVEGLQTATKNLKEYRKKVSELLGIIRSRGIKSDYAKDCIDEICSIRLDNTGALV